MGVIKFIVRIIGWLVTIVLQYAASNLVIFIFSVIFAGVDTISRIGWLALLLVIWVGFLLGINLVGWAALRWAWKDTRPLAKQRLLGSAIGAIIPLLILIPIGYSVPVGDAGTSFYDLVTNNWQPIMAQASFFAGIVGFYVPGLIKTQSHAKSSLG
jgi:hypothetical protein